MASGSDFVTNYRNATTALLAALDTLMNLRRQYDALDLGNVLVAGDFAGANADITKAQLVAAVGSSETLNTTFNQGHGTNLYKLKS